MTMRAPFTISLDALHGEGVRPGRPVPVYVATKAHAWDPDTVTSDPSKAPPGSGPIGEIEVTDNEEETPK